MILWFLVSIAFSASAAAPASAVIHQDEVRTTREGYVFCLNEKDLDKAIEFAASGDRVAFAKFIEEKHPFCAITSSGVRVYVTKVKAFSGKVRIRPVGETTEFWTLIEAVSKS